MSEGSTRTTTTAGRIIGRAEDGAYIFRGVPYGQADRFRPPAPPAPWDGERDATRLGPRAVQATAPDMTFGEAPKELADYFAGGDANLRETEDNDEDCLVLNITTPQPDHAARPVLVYIHGGAFDSGSGHPAVWGTRLAEEQDVVVVGVNHRLNIFGFLYLCDLDDSFTAANVGMLDLVLALRWLRDNIAAFGGDPDNITLFGESGGGMKISALLAMPAAAGLFHKAIVQSGPFLEAVPPETATANARRLLAALDASPRDLLAMPAGELFDAWAAAKIPMAPVVDGAVLPHSPFAPDAPSMAADIPLIIGHTLDEIMIAVHFLDDETIRSLIALPDDQRTQVEGAFATEFPALSARRRLGRIASDLSFGNATQIQAERKAAQPAPVYRYIIGYEPPILDGALGAFHGMDVPMALRAVAFPETEAFSRTIGAAWAAFARSGDPSTMELAWPRFDVEDRMTMLLGDEPKAVSDPYRGVREAWGVTPPTRGVLELIS